MPAGRLRGKITCMEQLLSIKHIPIKVEVKVQRPEFRRVENQGISNTTPSVKVSAKKDGGLTLRAEPYQMDLSTLRNYDSYVPSSGSDGDIVLTYEGIAKLVDNGTSGTKLSSETQQFTAKKASRSIESVLQSLPKSKNSAVSYSDGTLSINYSMQNTDNSSEAYFSERPEFEFIPGSIEFIIEQMPKLDIEYLGDPIYFPRSADPNYEPPLDVFA